MRKLIKRFNFKAATSIKAERMQTQIKSIHKFLIAFETRRQSEANERTSERELHNSIVNVLTFILIGNKPKSIKQQTTHASNYLRLLKVHTFAFEAQNEMIRIVIIVHSTRRIVKAVKVQPSEWSQQKKSVFVRDDATCIRNATLASLDVHLIVF